MSCQPKSIERRRRRGSAYLVVLAGTMIVATLALGAIMAVRARARAVDLTSDQAEARFYAASAVELGRLWISQDANWRTNRQNGIWATDQSIGDGRFTLEVTDPIDGNLANRPHDPVILKATAVKGNARQILQVTLAANPTPLPSLSCALHTGGQLHIRSGKRLTAKLNTISTNGSLRNDGTMTGNVQVGSATNTGNINGTLVVGSPPMAFPDAGIPELYAKLGTQISPGNTIDRQVLGPGRNPWGTPNPEGVYVIRSSGDLTIRRTRIYGTLVVICPGKKVTIDSNVFIHPVRSDYPSLIIDGNATFQFASASAVLSETTEGVNFNPNGVAYEGSFDLDTADQYPSEIQGLVHVRGSVILNNTALIRGALICESTATTDAVDCQNVNEIIYIPSLYTNPPQWYTTDVKMLPQTGSWQQVVD